MHTPYERAVMRLTRREFLTVSSRLGAGSVLLSQFPRKLWAKPVFTSYPFTLGVASGDPAPDGVVLWTRLAPDPLGDGGMPMNAVQLNWELGSDKQMMNLVQRGTAIAYAELGHSVHVEVEGLQPGRDYWYRFVVNGIASPVGRTRTAPAKDAIMDQLKLGICGCNHYEQGFFTAYRYMAEEQFDAIFHTGDYIYEYAPYDGKSARVREHIGCETFTVQDYRKRYALYKLDPDLQAAHASAPFITTWDDHEIDNDWASQFSETNTPPEVFGLRRAAAFQAYYEAMPLRKSSFPRASHLQLFRQIQFGNLASFNVLDTRQYRSRQACRTKAICNDFTDADRSMLGARQEQWLQNNLARNECRWQVLVQQVPLFGREPSDQQQNRHVMDKWSGYPAARERLVSGFADNSSGNVVILSGDIHSHWAADVPRRMAEPDGPSVAVELTTTSVSSGGDGSVTADYWSAIKADHPHVRYHSNRRGYLSCQVTHEAWQADYMTLDSVTTLHGLLKRDKRVVVTTGNPNLLNTKS